MLINENIGCYTPSVWDMLYRMQQYHTSTSINSINAFLCSIATISPSIIIPFQSIASSGSLKAHTRIRVPNFSLADTHADIPVSSFSFLLSALRNSFR